MKSSLFSLPNLLCLLCACGGAPFEQSAGTDAAGDSVEPTTTNDAANEVQSTSPVGTAAVQADSGGKEPALLDGGTEATAVLEAGGQSPDGMTADEPTGLPQCFYGAKQCTDGMHYQTCGQDQQWSAPVACVHETCEGGTCGAECAPGTTQCAPDPTLLPSVMVFDGTQTCDTNGQWEPYTICPFSGSNTVRPTCLAGTCVDCLPGWSECLGASSFIQCSRTNPNTWDLASAVQCATSTPNCHDTGHFDTSTMMSIPTAVCSNP
jgi:hypothetical protein